MSFKEIERLNELLKEMDTRPLTDSEKQEVIDLERAEDYYNEKASQNI